MNQPTEQLDAEVLMRCREAWERGRVVVTGTLLQRRLPHVSPFRLRGALDRLEERGAIVRRRIADGRRTKKREYVMPSNGGGA